jgi:alpha-1,3-rhamnosyl/mannosyltransferase
MSTWSGIGRYSTGLARSLARMDGIEIVQVIEEGTQAPVPEAETHTARVHAFYPTGGFELGGIVRRVDPDLTHCLHVPTPIPARHPLAVTIHDVTPIVIPEVMPSSIQRSAYRLWNVRATWDAERLLANSNATKADLSRYFPRSNGKVTVVPHAADDFADIVATPLPASLVGDGSPYLMSMGNIKAHKDLPTLLKAFVAVHAAHPELRLILVGRDRPGYVASVLGGVPAAARVSFSGHLPDGVLRSLYEGAEVFVFPSRYEGFGLPPLEAMISGTPVVCSTAASLPEVVGSAALTFAPGDVATAAARIIEVLEDSALRARLVEAGTRQAAMFTWERTASETARVYRELLASHSA